LEEKNISRTKVWLKAFRLHTLPLAFACISMGNFLVYKTGKFQPSIAILTFATTLCLQILSNLANDFGDSKHGADNNDRKGPQRMVQSGMITISQIKTGILVFIILSLLCGISLIVLSIANIWYQGAMILFVLGLLSIGAAYAYTASKKPYGYRGLGDISVFIFFGLVSVIGSYYLQAGTIPAMVLLPAIGMGMLCTGVLNVNNIRDIEADKAANKVTIPVKIGMKKAKVYHWLLMTVPIVLFAIYILASSTNYLQILFMAPAILFIMNAMGVSKSYKPEEINPYLKKLAISTLVFSVCYGVGVVFFH
jgi:1,4-dihydroxy-2-naphthoate octaprenyltransferase